MLKRLLDLFLNRLKRKRDETVSAINHEGVLKDVFLEVEITPGYFLILSLANLIALTGLIVNSAPVIIGAMLISPMMGPILSTGFAFVTGNRTIWVRAVRKVSLSVAMTLIVAAAASFLSPLQDITAEIASRTRPNLFDLLIAIFAGLAGAMAICTKKNYITIVPGVAIATAVIPPLSVAGFGLGTGAFKVMAGGFFLFFTNFVAIIISTCAVLYFFGFTPSADSGLERDAMKKRIIFLASVLFVISIPLIYTLHRAVAELGLKKEITAALKGQFDRQGVSRLSTFTHREKSDGTIDISAVINTTRYLSEKEIARSEQEIHAKLRQPTAFQLEQIKVQPGGLKEEPAVKPTLAPLPEKPRSPAEIVTGARSDLMPLLRRATERINGIISPSAVREFSLAFPSRGAEVYLNFIIDRDYPISDDEVRMLGKMAAAEIGVPVRLSIETVPFIPPLVFPDGEVAISEEMGRSLLVAGQVFERDPDINVTVTSRPAYPSGNKRNRLSARKRGEAAARFLTEKCSIPKERISTLTATAEKGEKPLVTLRILPLRKENP